MRINIITNQRAKTFLFRMVLSTMVLFLWSQVAEAQSDGIKGRLSSIGHTMSYNITGFKVTKEEGPVRDGGVDLKVQGTVKPGSIITFDIHKVSGQGESEMCRATKFDRADDMRYWSPTGPMMQYKKQSSMTGHYTIPNERGIYTMWFCYRPPTEGWAQDIVITISLDVGGEAETPKKYTRYTPEYDTGPCPYCGKADSKIRFNDFYGEVSYRCNDEEDDAYEYAELESVIHNNDRIRTKEDSGAVLSFEDLSTFVIKPESIIIIDNEVEEISKIKILWGRLVTNIKKVSEGKSIDFEMSHCVCGNKGTIVAFEETGYDSRVYLLAGKVEVTSKKTGKKTMLNPGQFSTTSKSGVIQVGNFDIKTVAGQYGVSMDEIRNHYSNQTTSRSASNISLSVSDWYAEGTTAHVKFANRSNQKATFDYGFMLSDTSIQGADKVAITNTKEFGANRSNSFSFDLKTIVKFDGSYRLQPCYRVKGGGSYVVMNHYIDFNVRGGKITIQRTSKR